MYYNVVYYIFPFILLYLRSMLQKLIKTDENAKHEHYRDIINIFKNI